MYQTATEIYKNKNIGTWFYNQKYKINSSSDDKYKIFSTNVHVKKCLDEHLEDIELKKLT